ncbi:MAG: two-partner secretion domain-containing protein, partial [Planctomycetota bacterium]
MTPRYRSVTCSIAMALALGVAVAGSARAQVVTDIVTDGSVGPATTVTDVGGVFEIGEGLGERHGRNLFQSFERFSVGTGDTALFTANPTFATDNVLSRVTGGVRSDIYGTIASAIPGADIYLINPAGLVFGPGGSLDVQGSFFSSTGDYLELSDPAQRFHADLGRTSSLSAAPVSAFGFLNRDPAAAPAGIRVDESILQVPFGETLAFIADDIQIRGGPWGILHAPSGRIALVAVRSDGLVRLDPADPMGAPELEGFTERGDILLGDFAWLNVGAPWADAGAIYVRGRNLRVEDGSKLIADDGFTVFGWGSGWWEAGGLVDIEVDGAAEFFSGSEIGVNAPFMGTVRLDVGSLDVDGSSIEAVAWQSLPGGGITVSATGDVRIVNGGRLWTCAGSSWFTGGVIDTDARGDVVIQTAGDVLVANGGRIQTNTEGVVHGDAGHIVIDARQVTIDAAEVRSGTLGVGDAGDIS